MNNKKSFFPHQPNGASTNSDEHSSSNTNCDNAFQPRHAAKGRAAYAASDDGLPPMSECRNSGFGPIGGLFVDDAAGPKGHGIQAQAENGDLLSVVSKDELLAECQKRVCPDCPVNREAGEAKLRALAELDNARKRLNREKEEMVRFASEAVLADLMPSLDNLDLALQHAPQDDVSRNFVIGVQMTRKLLQEALNKHGLTQIGAIGEDFDPAIHEAVSVVANADMPDGTVCGLLSSGYRLKDRLLRPAKVMVSKNS